MNLSVDLWLTILTQAVDSVVMLSHFAEIEFFYVVVSFVSFYLEVLRSAE